MSACVRVHFPPSKGKVHRQEERFADGVNVPSDMVSESGTLRRAVWRKQRGTDAVMGMQMNVVHVPDCLSHGILYYLSCFTYAGAESNCFIFDRRWW